MCEAPKAGTHKEEVTLTAQEEPAALTPQIYPSEAHVGLPTRPEGEETVWPEATKPVVSVSATSGH